MDSSCVLKRPQASGTPNTPCAAHCVHVLRWGRGNRQRAARWMTPGPTSTARHQARRSWRRRASRCRAAPAAGRRGSPSRALLPTAIMPAAGAADRRANARALDELINCVGIHRPPAPASAPAPCVPSSLVRPSTWRTSVSLMATTGKGLRLAPRSACDATAICSCS